MTIMADFDERGAARGAGAIKPRARPDSLAVIAAARVGVGGQGRRHLMRGNALIINATPMITCSPLESFGLIYYCV